MASADIGRGAARSAFLAVGAGLAVLAPYVAHASSGLDQSFLQPMGPVAEEQYDHLLRVIGITMVVILPVLIGVPYILWRYRYAKPRGEYRPEWEFSKGLEWALWGVPVAVVLVLAGWLWHSTAKLDPYRRLGPEPLQVQAIGLDWKWVFIYPDDGIATVDELTVPVGRPVELTLTTDTVMQSLLISSLTGQIYAMPGMTTKLNFAASRTGEAEGENTQFNGRGFGRQKFVVRALDPAEYADWARGASRDLVLDGPTYATLRRQSVLIEARDDLGLEKGAEPIVMALGVTNLFDRIIAKYHGRGADDRADFLGGTGLPSDTAKESGR